MALRNREKKRTNIELQNIMLQTNDWVTRTAPKTWDELPRSVEGYAVHAILVAPFVSFLLQNRLYLFD